MLKKELILEMATRLKMDIPAVTAAIDATDVVDIPNAISPELKVFNKADLDSRDESIKTTTIKAGIEIAVKNLKEKVGLTYEGEGSKDPERFVTEFKKKVLADGGVEESKKVTELNTTISQLRTNIETMQTNTQRIETERKQEKYDQRLLTETIDQKPDTYTNEEWLGLLKVGGISLEDKEGVTVVKRGPDVIVEGTTLKPIAVKDALTGFITEKKWGKAAATTTDTRTPGRDGQDSKSVVGIKNMKQFSDHLKSNNIHEGSEQAAALLTTVTSANKDFDYSIK